MTEFLETTIDKFLFKVARDRLYSAEGLWMLEENGLVRLGLTDYQQQVGGDVAFVHLRPVDTALAAGDPLVEVETIKATLDFRAPLAGTLVEVNPRLSGSPELVNESPYEDGWLAVIAPVDRAADRARLLSAEAYLTVMRAQAEEALGR